MIGVIALLVGLINWGLGLIVGALLAYSCGRSLERRSIAALICAAGYTGMLVWHGGLSGSAPLTMTTSASVLPKEVVEQLGIESVPLGDTIFSGLNIMVTIGLLVLVPSRSTCSLPDTGPDHDHGGPRHLRSRHHP